MIIAINRYQFNYLYKQNTVDVNLESISQVGLEDFENGSKSNLIFYINELDRILPVFEEDHEVLLLEYKSDSLVYRNRVKIEFSRIQNIYPLTATGARLLEGKLNPHFRIEKPVFEALIEKVKLLREIELRKNAAVKLIQLFGLVEPSAEIINKIEVGIKNLIDTKYFNLSTTENIFHTLLAYNKTESFIPEGNIEYMCKIAVLARLHLKQDAETVKHGPFYNFLLSHTQDFKPLDLFSAYRSFQILVKKEFEDGYQKIKNIIGFSDVDMPLVVYSFFAFKHILLLNDKDIIILDKLIIRIIELDRKAAAVVLYCLGTLFSFDQLYEGIHRLSGVSILSNSLSKNNYENRNDTNSYVNEIKYNDDLPPADDKHSIKSNESIAEEGISIFNTITYQEDNIPTLSAGETGIENTAKSEKSVNDFKNWVIKNVAKTKKKKWEDFIKAFFPDKGFTLTSTILFSKLKENPESYKRLAITQKDKDAILTFFAS